MRTVATSRFGARFVVPTAIALMTVGLIGASQLTASASGKVDPRVTSQMQAHGKAGFWVLLHARADLSRAPSIHNWNARGAFVVHQLKSVASASQQGLRAYLDRQHVAYQSFWIVNGIRVAGADAGVLNSVAARSDVARVVPTWSTALVDTGGVHVTARVRPDGVQWNIKFIGANKVWKKFGDRGEGVVVGGIDTGVQFDHPALVNSYRGNLGGGNFNHNYNWWDPSNICAQPAPCDNVGHGSHTMGTMVGLDGATKIGVAPKAKWIEAKGCETNSCSDAALLSAGQFMLAPTNLNGKKPKAALRPDVVNNSWGDPNGGNTFYQATVNAWVASGIFPQFANGNSGPSCGTVGAPGSYVNSYGAGAFDINGTIASFSSRGPSPFSNEIKPNISAPGVSVFSSVPTNSYASFSGTSMASPHVAGTVALLISKNPALRGDITQLRSILDTTAVDVNATTCGGTVADNNVFGEGRLDAFAAVKAAGP